MSSAPISIPSFDPSLLLSYYAAKLPVSTAQPASTPAQNTNSATANDSPPWYVTTQPAQEVEDAKVLSTTNFIDLSNVPQNSGSAADQKTEQDNQKLFSLYQAVNTLTYLAQMSQRDDVTAGQRQGYDTRFQQGLQQVQSFIASQTFNNFTLQATQPSSSVTSTVSIPFGSMGYTGGTVTSDANLSNALGGVSTSDSFTISVKKNGVTTSVPIDLSQVQGPLTLDNIVGYVNQQMTAAGFSTRFQRVMTSGTIDDPTSATYGIAINPAPSEAITLSSASATPALYVAGTTGSASGSAGIASATGSTIGAVAPDQQGRLIKLTDLSGTPQGAFNATTDPDNGTTTAASTVVDANGNVYTLGNATGDFGNQLNQGSQDVVLTKYDSAGNLQWSKLLGSAGDASGYSMALDPTGGVVVAGSTDANITTAAIANGNADSFVAKYDADGNQTWVKQIQTLSSNQANSVSVDASGNVYLGGQVTGTIGAGQTNAGSSDAYVAKLDSKGNVVYEQQMGTSGSDAVAATATTSDGGLVVASTQNGHAIISKYANGDATTAPVWQVDLGNLQNGGALGGLTVSGNNVYVSGTTSNTALNAGGAASIANASSGSTDAFVFNLTDNGASATANSVSYVGTGANDRGGAVTVGPDGTVYLTGTTTGTFAGQTRTVAGTNNAFVSAIGANGAVNWTQQYGGASGQSTGAGIAIDPTGSSVLDALGLPRGTLDTNESVDLASNTTLRAGDSFQIQIQGAATRTATITIDPGETMDSLAQKISNAMVFSGSATATYANGGKALKISVDPGITATLIAGPADFDALSRLGIAPGTITNPSTASSSTSTASTAKTTGAASQVFGLGFSGQPLDIATQTDAGAARAQLQNVMNAITSAYRTTNTAPSTSTTPAITGTAPAYLTAQLASYQTALSALTAINGGSTSATSTTG
jgi:hypothetical protein